MSQACEFPDSNPGSDGLARILREAKRIAVVGLSPKPDRPSHDVALYLMKQGYEVIPVNPGQKEILGMPCYKSLREVPGPLDMADVFRPPEAVPEVVEDAIAKGVKAVWTQLGIVNNAAAQRARAAGLQVVMNKCTKVEHARLKAMGRL